MVSLVPHALFPIHSIKHHDVGNLAAETGTPSCKLLRHVKVSGRTEGLSFLSHYWNTDIVSQSIKCEKINKGRAFDKAEYLLCSQPTMVPSPPPRYTSEQVDRYLSHINFTGRRIYPGDAKRASGLSYLTALQKHQMAKVPFENLSLHYSKEHHLSLEPQDLYHKVVERGHGGYCMENNCFFGTILRSLGFQIYSAGARVYNSDDSSNDSYSGWYESSLRIRAGLLDSAG